MQVMLLKVEVTVGVVATIERMSHDGCLTDVCIAPSEYIQWELLIDRFGVYN